MKTAQFFCEKEFKTCVPPGSMQDMDQRLLTMLDACRREAGIPFILNSAYRSEEYDRAKGRTTNSAHHRGLAVDIRATDGATKYKIVEAALFVGFNRIGIGSTFIHLDCDESLPQNVIWTY